MLFNSQIFLYLFLPATFLGYWFLNGRHLVRAATTWLFLCSLVFYAWWNPAYLPLILGSIGVNFTVARLILRGNERRANGGRFALFAGLAFNVGLLAYFKYADFFAGTVAAFLGRPHESYDILLPLAVSFFSIQQIVFLVDTYQGLCARVSPLQYAVYVSFFPHLIAGPIVLHNELIPQFANLRSKVFSPSAGVQGLLLLSVGLLKKLLIADTLSIWAKAGFDGVGPLGFLDAWSASLSYSLQLYFDFSGYSDMAVGIALLFHLTLPANFRSPLRARNIIAFWQTWHITLSRFITSYLYAPILRSFAKINFSRSMLATMLAMLIAGLWHGADWRFVAFGAMHGGALVANHVWRRSKRKLPGALGWALTFFWVNLSFVFFRAPSWAAVWRMLGAMFGAPSLAGFDWRPFPLIVAAFLIVFLFPNTEEIHARMKRPGFGWALASGFVLALALGAMEFQNANEFLYFKF
jgi:alginate O-acetyltransferase complex protein AlgI